MKLIDKEILLLKIDSKIEEAQKVFNDFPSSVIGGIIEGYTRTKKIISSLEVKDVDLEKEIALVKGDYEQVDVAWNNDFDFIARHFFELGLKAQSSNVWHYVSTETPTKFGEPIIIASKNKNKEDGIWLYDLIQSWEGEWNPRVNWETPVKWAYMDDLF